MAGTTGLEPATFPLDQRDVLTKFPWITCSTERLHLYGQALNFDNGGDDPD